MAKKFTVDQVLELAKNHRVVPLIETIFSGSDAPLAIYDKVTAGKSGTFLLESAEHGVWSRYSFIGVNNRGSLTQTSNGSVVWWSADGHAALPIDTGRELPSSALDAVATLHESWNSIPIAGLPPLTSGLVGALAWDTIREIENLPNKPAQRYNSPNMVFQMFRDLIIVDHHESNLLLVSNIFIEGQSESEIASLYSKAQEHIDDLRSSLLKPSEPFLASRSEADLDAVVANFEREFFVDMVEKAKKHVAAGDVFQVVLSQRFDLQTEATPLEIYRVLRALNPSPYMYLLNLSDDLGDYAIVGSSPEALVTVNNGRAIMHPIAGSRRRGADWDEDNSLENELLSDAKERAEHLMLVDLGRNDLGRVCAPGTVEVVDFMHIERYSHVMHIVSTVIGKLSKKSSPVDALFSVFPAGTLSGAPKPRAMEIIEELETTRRGVYGGIVGYIDFTGNLDTCIAIRTALLHKGTAYVQAGAGVVADSDPESENQECRNKAAAVLTAVHAANRLVQSS